MLLTIIALYEFLPGVNRLLDFLQLPLSQPKVLSDPTINIDNIKLENHAQLLILRRNVAEHVFRFGCAGQLTDGHGVVFGEDVAHLGKVVVHLWAVAVEPEEEQVGFRVRIGEMERSDISHLHVRGLVLVGRVSDWRFGEVHGLAVHVDLEVVMMNVSKVPRSVWTALALTVSTRNPSMPFSSQNTIASS